MEGLNEDGQWIILMGFVISAGIFFLAILMNQSVLVGQTTAESVLEFPKSEIQDLKSEIWVIHSRYKADLPARNASIQDIEEIALTRNTAVVLVEPDPDGSHPWIIHYNNGITNYTEEVKNEGGYYYFHY